jgi:hypothetical protein
MPEDSTTPDLVALGRQAYEAMSRGDLDAVMSLFVADALYDGSAQGIGTFEGAEADQGPHRGLASQLGGISVRGGGDSRSRARGRA